MLVFLPKSRPFGGFSVVAQRVILLIGTTGRRRLVFVSPHIHNRGGSAAGIGSVGVVHFARVAVKVGSD